MLWMSLCPEYWHSDSAKLNKMLVCFQTEIVKSMTTAVLLTNPWKRADHAGLLQGATHTSMMF